VSAAVTGVRHHIRVPLNRIAWLTTVCICVVATILLLVADYYGYAGVLAAVGLSAAINLR
jgi:hypothetical protein